jgi:hypothetical protein
MLIESRTSETIKCGKNERYSRESISKRNGKKIVGVVQDGRCPR